MVGLVALGLVLVNVLGRGKPSVSEKQAVAIARPRIDFKPQSYQIRFIRRGIPPRGYWIVSFFIPKQGGGYKRVTVVLVDAATGKVAEVRRVT
jgi:Peptidase propeptide and YPEB domain